MTASSAVRSTSILNSVDLLGKHEARQPVAVRVLLPVDEMLGRRDLERIARDPRAAMRRRPQPDRLRPERDRPVVGVAGDVMQADENRQKRAPCPDGSACPSKARAAGQLAASATDASIRRGPAPRSAQFGGAGAPSMARKPAARRGVRICLHRRGACGKRSRRRSVAQLVEHRSPKPGVGGSSPSSPASASMLISLLPAH